MSKTPPVNCGFSSRSCQIHVQIMSLQSCFSTPAMQKKKATGCWCRRSSISRVTVVDFPHPGGPSRWSTRQRPSSRHIWKRGCFPIHSQDPSSLSARIRSKMSTAGLGSSHLFSSLRRPTAVLRCQSGILHSGRHKGGEEETTHGSILLISKSSSAFDVFTAETRPTMASSTARYFCDAASLKRHIAR